MSAPPLVIHFEHSIPGDLCLEDLAGPRINVSEIARGSNNSLRLVLEQLGVSEQAFSLPAGAFRARAVSADVRGTVYCAEFVTLFPDLDNITMGPVVADLSAAELEILEADLDALLSNHGLHLTAGPPGSGYVRASEAFDFSASAPGQLYGSPLRDAQPGGPSGALVRAAQMEVQMYLHEHPLNQQRHERGLMPVSALWLWDGGALPPPLALKLPGLIGDDATLRGFWQHNGYQALRAPTTEFALKNLRDIGVLSISMPRDELLKRLQSLCVSMARSRELILLPQSGPLWRLRSKRKFGFRSLFGADSETK